MNKTICIAAILVALPLTWLAGEQHRANCIHQGHTACTALPWNHGQPRRALQASDPLKGWSTCQVKTPGGPCIVPLP